MNASDTSAATSAGTGLVIAGTGPTPVDTSKIAGWGVDADPANDPTYPYRDRSKDDGLRSDWARPPQQHSTVEVLQSIEHKRLPAVFGTSTPPSWISGMMRRAAFRWSESNWIHWLLLMGADRVNVVEGVVQDLGRGKVPNIPAEMGARAEWEHNKKGLATKAAVTVALTAGIAAFFWSRRSGTGASKALNKTKGLPAGQALDGPSGKTLPPPPGDFIPPT